MLTERNWKLDPCDTGWSKKNGRPMYASRPENAQNLRGGNKLRKHDAEERNVGPDNQADYYGKGKVFFCEQ
jgi:hypothetical protein